jgi:hypothetical protein
MAAIIAYIFFGLILWAKATSHWQTDVPRSVYMQLVPNANELGHAGT